MSPEQKELSDRLISIVTICLVSLLAIVVVVLLISEIRTSYQYKETAERLPTKETPLTIDEVQSERFILPYTTTTFDPTVDTFIPVTEETTVVPTTPGSVDDFITPAEEAYLEAPEGLVLLTEEGAVDQGMIVVAYGRSADDQYSYSSDSQFNTSQEQVAFLEGQVVAVADGAIRVKSTNNEFIIVRNTNQARTMINGKPMLAKDLQIGDVVRVEGMAVPESTELRATIIAVVGQVELFMTN